LSSSFATNLTTPSSIFQRAGLDDDVEDFVHAALGEFELIDFVLVESETTFGEHEVHAGQALEEARDVGER
jgi:hypothetical protein